MDWYWPQTLLTNIFLATQITQNPRGTPIALLLVLIFASPIHICVLLTPRAMLSFVSGTWLT